MPESILSDITIMGDGYCVIGLERASPDSWRSVRPMPPWGFAWREPFQYHRGDSVHYRPRPTKASPPHVEDTATYGLSRTPNSLDEDRLLACLQKAEVASSLEELFACRLERSTRGGRALWVKPTEAKRSICGCTYGNLRFRLLPEPGRFALRAEIVTSSNERVSSIPIVDREWQRFVEGVVQRIRRADPLPLAERFLNWSVRNKMFAVPRQFVRIGLPRPRLEQQCWLMLDSLFPQPDDAWLEML
jgi:hypothetical protein